MDPFPSPATNRSCSLLAPIPTTQPRRPSPSPSPSLTSSHRRHVHQQSAQSPIHPCHPTLFHHPIPSLPIPSLPRITSKVLYPRASVLTPTCAPSGDDAATTMVHSFPSSYPSSHPAIQPVFPLLTVHSLPPLIRGNPTADQLSSSYTRRPCTRTRQPPTSPPTHNQSPDRLGRAPRTRLSVRVAGAYHPLPPTNSSHAHLNHHPLTHSLSSTSTASKHSTVPKYSKPNHTADPQAPPPQIPHPYPAHTAQPSPLQSHPPAIHHSTAHARTCTPAPPPSRRPVLRIVIAVECRSAAQCSECRSLSVSRAVVVWDRGGGAGLGGGVAGLGWGQDADRMG